MENFTKKDLLMILNVYQNYTNDFVNISKKDLDKIYLEIAKKDFSTDLDSLSQERPYIRYKTSVLKQMIEESCGEELYKMCKELDYRNELIYAVEKYLYTSEPKTFKTDEELVKWLRGRNVDENNELSDEYIINEAISIGEIKQVKRKDIGNLNTRN